MSYWYQKQLRVLQTVLREIDIIDYDARAVVDYMKRTRSNTLVVNAGGIVDFFHNDVEPSCHNRFMKDDQEILEDLCREVHSERFHIIARVDFRGVQKYRYDARPDWFACLPDGSPKLNPQGLCSPCYLSRYANEHAVEFVTRLMKRFPLDGIWENSVIFGAGICYCKRCRESYMKDTGKELPQTDDVFSPALNIYREWRKTKAEDHLRLIRSAVKKHSDDKAYVAEVFGMYHAWAALHSGIDTYSAGLFDFAVGVGFLTGAPHGRPYDELSYASSAARFLRAIEPSKPAVLLTGSNGTKWRLVGDPALETRLWMWEAVAAGASLWNCYFNGISPDAAEDRRNAYIETDAYCYLEENEDALSGLVPVHEVAILFSKPSRDLFGRESEHDDRYGTGIKGLEKVLGDAHIPYGFITDRDLSLTALHDVRVLCLPNCACLSEKHAQIIREYVRCGGTLLASFETSLYDETGAARHDFLLSDVLGVSSTGIRKDTSQDCYQMVRLPRHPLLHGMRAEQTRFLISGGETLLTVPNGNGETVASYVPIIPNQYPEQAWIQTVDTRFPTVYCSSYGKGRVVYFANNMEAMALLNGHDDFWNLVHNALCYLRGESWSLETIAPPTTRIHFMQSSVNPGSFVLSCVNHLTGYGRPARYLRPADAFTVNLRFLGVENITVETLYPKCDNNVEIVSQNIINETLEATLRFPGFKEFISVSIQVK